MTDVGPTPAARTGIVTVAIAAALAISATGSAQAPPCVTPPSGLVAWWTGDYTTEDHVGTNDGVWVGSSNTYWSGLVGYSFWINGAGWIQVPDSASLDITGAITIDAWIYAPRFGGRVVDKITAGGADGYMLDTFADRVRLIIDGSALSGTTVLTSYRDRWIHVAGTFDGTTMRVYLNGVLDGSTTPDPGTWTNNLPLRIGADQDGASRFSGAIDEVELFNRALSASELLALYNAGAAGKCRGNEEAKRIPVNDQVALWTLFLVLAGAGAVALRGAGR
jgi:hypothetical protein